MKNSEDGARKITILRAFFFNWLFFICLLIAFAVWQYVLLEQRDESFQVERTHLEEQDRCIRCCFDLDSQRACHGCYDSVSFCAKGRTRRNQTGYYTQNEVEKIIDEEIDTLLIHWNDEVLESLQHDNKFEEAQRKIQEVPKKCLRPAAHLTYRNTKPDEHGHMRRWRVEPGGGYTFEQGGLKYNESEGVLKVTKDGRYNIHLQITFRGANPGIRGTPTISYQVLLLQPTVDESTEIMANSKHLSEERNELELFHTLSSNSVQELNNNDKLKIYCSMPDHISIDSAGYSTYFDVVMT